MLEPNRMNSCWFGLTEKKMAVEFSEMIEMLPAIEESKDIGSDSNTSSSDFREITSSSNAEGIASSDEDDANLLEVVLGSANSCDPSLLKKVLETTLLQETHFYLLTKT